mmetsp:Transcript_23967/g.43332  ORF Transcript_23967/g.43332 Transcript_23967/m.43332 type:complete len:112 (-) Transcript_23967:684-1019(-)
MGSNQSAEQAASSNLANYKPVTKEKNKLTGFALVQHKCRKKKKSYETCYAQWYGSSFAVGKLQSDERVDCDDLFDDYRGCVLKGMQRDRDRRGLPAPGPESMLSELDDEND